MCLTTHLFTCASWQQVCIFPFLAAWFARQGLNSQQIGIINSLRPWMQLPSSPG
jgi:hypothetical protein